MSKIVRTLLCGFVLAAILAGCAVQNINKASAPVNNVIPVNQDQTRSGSQRNDNEAKVTAGNVSEINQANVFDKTTVKVGDKIAGLTVKSIKLSARGGLRDIKFSGEIELAGICEWADDTGDRPAYMFRVDEAFVDKLPQLKSFGAGRYMLIKNRDYAEKFFPKQKGGIKARIIIDNYSIGERDIRFSAYLVKVLEVFPQQAK